MVLFDTHAHLDDKQFDGDRASMIERALAAGVQTMIAVGTTLESSRKCIQLATQFPSVHAAVGIQPNCCAEAGPGDWSEIEKLVIDHRDHVVAIGETGLDRYWDFSPFDLQQDYFDRHIQLARRHELPFIVHMRDCDQDIINSLEPYCARGGLNGVMHSFTGNGEMARRCLEMGMHISFAGMVTFKKSNDLREVARSIPDERILIETDAPYLSPHPKRGQRPNEPALLEHTARCLAKVRESSSERFAQISTQNARRLFGLDE